MVGSYRGQMKTHDRNTEGGRNHHRRIESTSVKAFSNRTNCVFVLLRFCHRTKGSRCSFLTLSSTTCRAWIFLRVAGHQPRHFEALEEETVKLMNAPSALAFIMATPRRQTGIPRLLRYAGRCTYVHNDKKVKRRTCYGIPSDAQATTVKKVQEGGQGQREAVSRFTARPEMTPHHRRYDQQEKLDHPEVKRRGIPGSGFRGSR